MNLSPATIQSLKNGYQACLKSAEKARGEHAFHVSKAAEHAVMARARLAEAEDYAEILRRADAADPVHDEPTPPIAPSLGMVAAIHAFATLLSTIGLPAELDTERTPRLQLRFRVESLAEAERIAAAVENTGGWRMSRPALHNPEYRWIDLARYAGTGGFLDVEIDLEYAADPDQAPAEPEAGAS